MSFKNTLLYLFSIILLTFGCKKTEANQTISNNKNIVKYANGFSIIGNDTYKRLIIKKGYKDNRTPDVFYIFTKDTEIPDSLKTKKIIRIPIEKIVVTGTTHIPMLEAIQAEHSLVGFPNTKYISSDKTRKLIQIGKVKDLENEQAMNIELLLALKPNVLIGFGVNQPSKMYQQLVTLGIPVIMNADWMEETPLGRAEWIKLFGLLYDKEKQADSIFHSIKTNYINLKSLAQKAKTNPSVLSGSLFQDIWYVPAGKSFLSQMIQDAHADYLWKDSEGNGSLALNIETVFAKAQHADFWVAPGDYTNYDRLSEQHSLIENFDAFQQQRIYSYAFQKNEYGGLMYFESSPLHPDWVLSDLIQIFHPEISYNSPMYYFKKLK